MTASPDMDTYRAELDTNGFRSQVAEIGARHFVRRLQFEAPHVTSIVWIRVEPYLADDVAVEYERAQRRAEAA